MQPHYSMNIFPYADFLVMLDQQMQFLATMPAARGCRGLQAYYTYYYG